jgi:hypothetical protein
VTSAEAAPAAGGGVAAADELIDTWLNDAPCAKLCANDLTPAL